MTSSSDNCNASSIKWLHAQILGITEGSASWSQKSSIDYKRVGAQRKHRVLLWLSDTDFHDCQSKLSFKLKFFHFFKFDFCNWTSPKPSIIENFELRRPDRQTDSQTDRQTNRQSDRQTNRKSDRQTNRQSDGEIIINMGAQV
jgi:hypothetical protein